MLVTNVRLGGLERLWLDPDSVTALSPAPDLYAITGYGLEEMTETEAAFDIAPSGPHGIAHLLTKPGEDPPFQRGGDGDHNAGLAGAAAVCAALYSGSARGRWSLRRCSERVSTR